MVRRPAGAHATRHPHRAVFGILRPRSVRVEIFVTHHIARNVSCGYRALLALIARGGPVVEIVPARKALGVVVQLVAAGEGVSLSRIQIVGASATRDLAAAASNVDKGRVSVRINCDPICTGTQNRECDIRSVHFEGFVFVKFPHVEEERPLRELDLSCLVVQIQE